MDDIFEKASEGGTDEDFEEKVEDQASKGAEEIPLKKREGTFENLQSQKDKLEKQLNEKEAAWQKEREEFLAKNQQNENQLQKLLQDMELIKNPPKPVEEAPLKPDDDDPYLMMKYQQDLMEYKDRMNQKRFDELASKVMQTEAQLKAEAEAKKTQQQYELYKATAIKELVERGRSPEEAQQIFQWASSQDSFTPDSIIAAWDFFKGNKPVQGKKEKEKFPLPPGVGGGADVNQNDADAMIDSVGGNKYKNIFEKK